MKHFDAVIFDMDGLLLDTETVALWAFTSVCERYSLGDHSAVFRRCIGTNRAAGEQVIREGLGHLIDTAMFISAWDALYTEKTTNTKIALKLRAKELLEHLHSLDVRVAVATSSATARAREKLGNAGIAQFFEIIVGGDQVAKSKPHPDIFLRVAELVGANPAQCLALEDSENGVRAAMNAGMDTVQIPDLVDPSPDLRLLGHIVLPSLLDVKAYPFTFDLNA